MSATEVDPTVKSPCPGDSCVTDSPENSKVSPQLVLGLSLVAFIGAVIFTIGMLIFIKRQCREEKKRTEEAIHKKQILEQQNGGIGGYKTAKRQNFSFVSKANAEVILGRKPTSGHGQPQYISRNVNIAAEGDAGEDEHSGEEHAYDNHLATTDVIMTAGNLDGEEDGQSRASNSDEDILRTKDERTESESIVNDIMDLVHSLESESVRSVCGDLDEPQFTVL